MKPNKMKSNLEKMFESGMRSLPPRKFIDKETQVELAHRINRIDQYGFEFFPGINIYDDVKYICDTAKKLNNQQETPAQ